MANKQTRKAIKAIETINANPDMSNVQIAKLAGCTNQYISYLRKKMAHVDPTPEDEVRTRVEANRHEVPAHQQHLITEHEWNGRGDRSWCRHGIDELGEQCEVCWKEDAEAMEARLKAELDFNDASTQEELDTVLEAASVLDQTALDTMLAARGLRYGTFLKRAIIAQRLKAVMADTPNWIALNDDMAESLEMIAHKISRILGGDPAYADSWVDIAGYAQLVADRLNGKER